MFICDNFISMETQIKVKTMLLEESFPWHFLYDVTDKHVNQNIRPAMVNVFCDHKGTYIDSCFAQTIGLLLNEMTEAIGFNLTRILQARTFLQFPLNVNFLKDRTVDDFHVDLEEDHYVLLYYVLDSDGDTVILDKDINTIKKQKISDENFVPKLHSTPKQGRFLFFNGKYFHSAFQPNSNLRCVINFDII